MNNLLRRFYESCKLKLEMCFFLEKIAERSKNYLFLLELIKDLVKVVLFVFIFLKERGSFSSPAWPLASLALNLGFFRKGGILVLAPRVRTRTVTSCWVLKKLLKTESRIALCVLTRKIMSNLAGPEVTCVTKSIANLTRYSRKPGNYNGTIIFAIDIMKNSSPLNLKFTSFAMSKPK